ncbi:MAG: transporter, drug/metabolite exporter family [uncultured bacterium]|nr:MAG: transporter, drug/metabolite exporter family [uncultured bacterium]
MKIIDNPSSHKALLLLLIVPLLWGLTFPAIKIAAPYISAEYFVVLRSLLAAVTLLPFTYFKLTTLSKRRVVDGLVLGALNGATLVCQTIGLKYLDPASSAFITGIGVIMVPFLLPLFNLGKPRLLNIFCSLMCLLGLHILTGALYPENLKGIFWTVGCATFYAIFVVYLQKINPRKEEVSALAFYQVIGTILLASVLALPQPMHIVFNQETCLSLFFCGCTTSVVLILQTRYQKFVAAPQVILIYSLEALFAAFFSYLMIGEVFSLRFMIGGIVMLGSILLNELGRPNVLT